MFRKLIRKAAEKLADKIYEILFDPSEHPRYLAEQVTTLSRKLDDRDEEIQILRQSINILREGRYISRF
jgi:excinuclease UvrABC helicase subunit UvrB